MRTNIFSIVFFGSLISISSFGAPKIFIKLDDLKAKSTWCPSIPTLDYLLQKKLKAGIGAIANQFDATALNKLSPYLNATNNSGDKLFEVWNHGLDHIQPEFYGTTYAYQKDHFDRATQLIKTYLGVQMHTLGTPYNANDAVTNTVISEDPNYKVCFFNSISQSAASGIVNINNKVDMENGTGNPEYAYFIANYNKYKSTYTNYMVLQGHPNEWTTAKIDQFNQIIEFLIAEGCEFVLPYDYYRSLTLYPPTNLKIDNSSQSKVDVSWTDNTTSEYNYKIERSIDGINWTIIGTSAENSTNYSDNITTLPVGSYYYRVYANCGIKSAYSNVVQTPIINAINKINYENNSIINIFPNPCFEKATISYNVSTTGIVSCNIYNVTGKLEKNLFQGQLDIGEYQFPCDLSNLLSGIYFCRINSSVGFSTKKIVVI